ncbi:hypothetical protein ACFL4A_04810 [bacterium]
MEKAPKEQVQKTKLYLTSLQDQLEKISHNLKTLNS